MNLTIKQLNEMKHAIGFRPGKVENGKYVALRNFFGVSVDNESWEELVKLELATKDHRFNEVVYHVSDKGKEVLGSILSVKIEFE